MTESVYGIAIIDGQGDEVLHENSRALFETMSGIKSVIGTFALEKMAKYGHELTDTLSVSRAQYSNGSGKLRQTFDARPDMSSVELSLHSVLTRSIVDSDCMATNALIDYVEGKEPVNQFIKDQLELPGMELVTDKIYFPGVDHQQQRFQVGMATMLDFAAYYKKLWATDNGTPPLASPHHGWHQQLHNKVNTARLFNMPQDELPANVGWTHKTGSAVDRQQGQFYKTMMDAGMLEVDGRQLFVAAAATVLHRGANSPSESTIEQAFANRNIAKLEDFGVELSVEEQVA